MVKICNDIFPSPSIIDTHFKQFTFELSPFQKYAIEATVTGNHALVTAHTGSGKTVPAEFAIKFFTNMGKKIIYTSPIKALSNQKYYEFINKFPDISFGILTGDIKFNPEADVLIMTTEILRNTLYKKKANTTPDFNMDLENELACVIFDEVHYINDADRGKVWEESIMLMPKHVQMILLSATIDKPEQFAQWIETQNKEKLVYLTSTDKRVVPLRHLTYLSINEAHLKKIKNPEIKKMIINTTNSFNNILINNKFNEPLFNKVNNITTYIKKNNINITDNYILNNLVEKLKKEKMLPAICFVFSRRKTTYYAKSIQFSLFDTDSKIPTLIDKECKQILAKLTNSHEYINLPEYLTLVELLEKGIAIHHAGLLPVFREMIELLFSKGYIKLLFATETFAVGINMPTKTVIFTDFMKFNGETRRYIKPHEYTQMAGRAGRRGIDTIGYVIHCNNMIEISSPAYKQLLSSTPQTFISKFKINYSIILNLINEYKINDIQTYVDYIKSSMLTREINKEFENIKTTVVNLQKDYDFMTISVQKLRTPYEIIMEFLDIKTTQNSKKNKERKRIEIQLKNMIDEYKFIISDSETVIKYKELDDNIKLEKLNLDKCQNYINNTIARLFNILEKNNFIYYSNKLYDNYYSYLNDLDYLEKLDYVNVENEKENKYLLLTNLGEVATFFQEIDSILITEMLYKFEFFNELTSINIVALISCFTNIKTHDDIKILSYKTEPLNKYLEFLDTRNHYYEDEEFNMENNIIHYDLIDEIIAWYEADDELTCKQIIINLQYEKNLFMGDFIKAVLKINNIINELKNVAVFLNNNSLLTKLEPISQKLLKYVATNQSLYI